MSNTLQLVLTIVTFVLGALTFGSNYVKPISDKVETINERLYRVEAQILRTAPSIPTPPYGK
jgi:hypothetical protein